jgi:hypothetical protein
MASISPRMTQLIGALVPVACLALLASCGVSYSFSGSDSGEAKTVQVDVFPNNAELVNPRLSQTFTEQLRTTLVQQSTLALAPRDADLVFTGAIVGYSVSPQAPTANETVALSRLTLVVEVQLNNQTDSKRNFSQRFTATRDYPSTRDLSAVEGSLMDEMCRELAEKIFSRALVNW